MGHLQKVLVACALFGGGFFLGHLVVPESEVYGQAVHGGMPYCVVTSSADGKTIYVWQKVAKGVPEHIYTAKVPN